MFATTEPIVATGTRTLRPGSEGREFSVRRPRCSLPPHLFGAFLLGCVHDLLQELGDSSYETKLLSKTAHGWDELAQFDELIFKNDEVMLLCLGPLACQISERLPVLVDERLARFVFDSDGFVVG